MRRSIQWWCGCLALAGGWVLASAGELPEKDQAAAHKLYVAKCAKCHKFYEPQNYDDATWSVWMDKMARKSKLKPVQTELLNRYLDSYRRAGRRDAGLSAPATKPVQNRK